LLFGDAVEQDLYDWKTESIRMNLKCDIPSYTKLIQHCFRGTSSSALVAAHTRSICLYDIINAKIFPLSDAIPLHELVFDLKRDDITKQDEAITLLSLLPSESIDEKILSITVPQNPEEDIKKLTEAVVQAFSAIYDLPQALDAIRKYPYNDPRLNNILVQVMEKKQSGVTNRKVALSILQTRELSESDVLKMLEVTKDWTFFGGESIIWVVGEAPVTSPSIIAKLEELLGQNKESQKTMPLVLALARKGKEMSEDDIVGWTRRIKEIVASEENETLKAAIAKQIKYISWPDISEILLDLMKDPDHTVKNEAGKSLNYLASLNG